jgi:hypothetical protein
MVTIILATALLVAVAGLAVEIGIASWNIRRANRYRQGKASAEINAGRAKNRRKEMEEHVNFMEEYSGELSWLLTFLYNRYNKFADLEDEINGGIKESGGGTPVGEADDRYKDLKRALKIIRITARASDRMETLRHSIRDDFRDYDEDAGRDSESGKPSEGGCEEPPEPEAVNF